MSDIIDIVIQETIDVVEITVNPNIIEVNVTRTSGGGGNQTLAQTLVLGNQTGGENIVINNADSVQLENGSSLKKGSYNFGANGGISRICSVDYEDMWQAGIRHVFDNNGLIRHSTNCFDVIPDSSFDNTLRFKVNSLWTLDNGTTYKCTDASTGAAVWEIYNNFIPNLTQVLTVEDKEFQQIDGDRDFVIADRLKYSLILGGMTMTLDDDLDLFPINSLIQFYVADNSDINATATLNFGAATSCYYLIENITTLTLNVGDFCELKKGSAGSAWLLNVWNKSSGGGGVPYTGATQDVDLGEFGLLTGNIEFDNTPTNIPTAAGSMVWNDTDGTVDLKLKGGNVTLQIGQENVLRVVNKTATNVNLLEANYQAVRVTGAQGQRLKVDLAQATTDTLSAETIGLVTETINNNQEGFITTSGLIRNIDTTGTLQSETWADGDILYLSPTVAGQLTKVKPTAPNHLVIIGYVVHAHATQGSIFVKVDNGYELNELHNVKITSETNGQALTYTSATDIWENKTIIEDAIVNGVTTAAPSQNAVFDALALKQNTATLIFDSLQKAIMRDNYFWFIPNSISTGVAAGFGYSERLVGNTFTLSNNGTLLRGLIPFSSTATAGTIAFMRKNDGMILTGLEVVFTRKIQFNSNVSGQRFFSGISKGNQFSAPTNVEPNTLTDIVGVCQLSSSTNMHVVHNDASGTATTIDLGSSYPCTDSQYNYYITIEQTTTTYIVTVERVTVSTGASISTTNTLTTNIPVYNTGTIQLLTWISNNATAAIASYLDGGAIGNVKNQ